MTGTISAMFTGGVIALACATTWVILYLQTKERKTSKTEIKMNDWMASATYGTIWLMAVMLFVAKILGV
jgi:hypothetical protein